MEVIFDVVTALRGIRERAGLSQNDLAERIGMSQQAVSAIERGETDPSYRVLVAWLNACKARMSIQQA